MRFTKNAWDNINETHLKKVLNYPILQKIETLNDKCFKLAMQRSKFRQGSMIWHKFDTELQELKNKKQLLINQIK
jgi:hypothetical protein